MKRSKEQVMNETAEILASDAAIIDVYEKVLSGELKRFPAYTWELPNSLYYARVLTRYLFEKKLNWTLDDIKRNLSFNIIRHYKLLGMYLAIFHTIFNLVDNAYPGKIKPWELKEVGRNFWDSIEHRKAALTWLFDEKLEGNMEKIKNHLSCDTFRQFGLYGLLVQYFDSSPHKAFEFIYPGKVKPWEFCKVPQNFWDSDKNKRDALKWLFEEIYDDDLTKIKQSFSSETFKQYNLGRLLKQFNGSPYKTVEFYYPGQVKPWEMHSIPFKSWISEEKRLEALTWLFEEILNGDLTKVNHKVFRDNGLDGLLCNYFDNSPYKAIEFVYPGKIKPWELGRVPRKFWKSEENKKMALEWLFNDKLKWTTNEIDEKLTINIFQINNLGSLLQNYFNNSPYLACRFLYPEKQFEKLLNRRETYGKRDNI